MILFRVDLAGSHLGFTARFWISMTEPFVTVNSFMKAEVNENQWIYQWICDIQIIWKLPCLILLRIIVFWTLWTLNYVGCIPFSCIDYFQLLFLNFRKIWLNLQLCGRSPIKLVLRVCLSVCLYAFDAFSSGSLWNFLDFCMRIYILAYILKSDKVIICLLPT